jgi:hypothetical protein
LSNVLAKSFATGYTIINRTERMSEFEKKSRCGRGNKGCPAAM